MQDGLVVGPTRGLGYYFTFGEKVYFINLIFHSLHPTILVFYHVLCHSSYPKLSSWYCIIMDVFHKYWTLRFRGDCWWVWSHKSEAHPVYRNEESQSTQSPNPSFRGSNYARMHTVGVPWSYRKPLWLPDGRDLTNIRFGKLSVQMICTYLRQNTYVQNKGKFGKLTNLCCSW